MTVPENALRAGISTPGPSFRGALASRDFTLLFLGQLTAGIGNGAVQLALPWLVLSLTGSAFQLGFAYFCQFLPMLLFGVLGGVFADRWDRRMTIVVVDVVRGFAFISVAAIYYLGELRVEHVYAAIFLESSLANFFNPARAALMPNLVSPENLRPANSLMEITRSIGFLVAPGAGAALIPLIGPAALFLIDGVTFMVSGLTVFLIKWRPAMREIKPAESLRHAIQIVAAQTVDGFQPIRRSRLFQVSLLLGFSLHLLISPIYVLLPLFVLDVKHADADYFAILVVAFLFGLIFGSLTAPAASHRLGLGKLTIASILILGAVICIAPWPPTILPPAIAIFIAGCSVGALNVAQTSMLQSSTTDEERGRASATYFTLTLGVRPFGFLAMGALATAVDIRLLFVALGVAAIGVGALLLRLPEVREHN
jgi:MFS family permease